MRLRSFLLALIVWGLAAQSSPALAGCTIGKIAELPVTMHGLRPTVTAKINGIEAPFIFDSGMFFSMLSPASVARFGLRAQAAPSNLVVSGVGGRADVQVATARELDFGGVVYKRPDFLVSERSMDPSVAGLLGANLVSRTDIEYDLANGVIRLFQEDGCKDASLAYWAVGKPYSAIDIDGSLADPHLRGSVSVNGVKIRVIFDTGAQTSMLGLGAAERAGVTPTSPGVVEAGVSNGIGLRSYVRDWIGPFASFKIGDEEIRNTRLRFGDMQLEDGTAMLLGMDFFLSHRIFVSRGQHKLYFTYNGGPVFNLGVAPRTTTDASSRQTSPAPSTADASTPTDALGYSRRAAAFASRREYAAAIDDLTKAIALDPSAADYVYQRALARLGDHQPVLAMADLDQTLKLKPDDIAALLVRAELRAATKDMDRAKPDLAAADRLAAKDPARRRGLASAYQRLGMWSEAIGQLDQWIAANPKDDGMAQALNARCWARAMLGLELGRALADCDAALRLLPGEPAFLASRGLVHLRRGEFDRGAADFDGVLRLQPNNAWALYGRGWARLKAGRKDQGDADIKAALALRPHLVDEAKARGLAL